MRDHDYWAYMITNKLRTALYVGMTNDLARRIAEHREGKANSFAARYDLNRLVWFEHFRQVEDAIACEKKLKGWRRVRKDDLIAQKNPRWLDLAADWQEQSPRIDDLKRWEAEIVGDSSLRSE